MTWHRFYWKWHVELGLLVVFIGLVGVSTLLLSTRGDVARQASLGAQSHAAVCALRADLRGREHQAEAFLRAHPHGALGLTAAQIRQSILNEQRTILALRALRC